MSVTLEQIKIERYLEISRDGLKNLVLAGGKSIYFPVPAEIRHLMEDVYGIDITKKDAVVLKCELIKEAEIKENLNNEFELKLVYTIKKKGARKTKGVEVNL